MDPEALCTCGCPYRRHRPQIGVGAVTLACFRHDDCESFTAAPPVPSPVVVEPVRPTVERCCPDKPTLIYAWNTRYCPDCGSRYLSEEAVCCGSICMPVRLEMHSREPL